MSPVEISIFIGVIILPRYASIVTRMPVTSLTLNVTPSCKSILLILLIICSASSSERSKLRIDVSISIVERIEMPIMDVTNIPPFMIKFSEYGEFATLSRKRSIIYIRIKMRASALFDFAIFFIFPLTCAPVRAITTAPPYTL